MAERLYYSDPFLQNFRARVTDARQVAGTSGPSLWQIALDRTAFYPTSGGQPYDLGVLRGAARDRADVEVAVASVEEDEAGEVWHYAAEPLARDMHVEGSIDWSRRFDHMQQHSGQHLLSAIFLRELHAPTVSFHLGEDSSTIDLAGESIAAASLERIEKLANEVIAEDRAMEIRTVPRTEAEALLSAGKLRKLPEREGTIRLIEIADLDLNACGGTHVRSTGQIGGLLLRATERVRQGLRVEFVCGQRAVRAARRDFATLGRAGGALSVGRTDVPAAVERLLADAKVAAKERYRLREELAEYHAARLAVEEIIEDHLRVVRRNFKDRDAEYIRMLASKLAASVPQTLALFASTEQEPAAVVMAHSADLDFSCGAMLKEALSELGLRGGGSADLAQGQVPREKLEALFDGLVADARARREATLRTH
jgi:alanyl-tRNA synthetase